MYVFSHQDGLKKIIIIRLDVTLLLRGKMQFFPVYPGFFNHLRADAMKNQVRVSSQVRMMNQSSIY